MREIFPQPGYTTSDVEEVLDSGSFIYAECFTLVNRLDEISLYTNFHDDISVVPIGGSVKDTYQSKIVEFRGLTFEAKVGLDNSSQEVELNYSDEATFSGGITWPEALLKGDLDGARIFRDRFFWNGSNWIGAIRMVSGKVGELSNVGQRSAQLQVDSEMTLLNSVGVPRSLWSTNCANVLGDVSCGVDLPSLGVSGSTGLGSTRTHIYWAASSAEYSLGKIHITGPDGNVRVRTVSIGDVEGLFLSNPLDFTPATSTAFTAYPGCNRTKERCPDFHPSDWQDHFKGFPYIPVAETAVVG